MTQIHINSGCIFYEEVEAFPGVRKVAGLVREDIRRIVGAAPGICRELSLFPEDKFKSDIDMSLSNSSIGADEPAAAFGETAFADFASARYKNGTNGCLVIFGTIGRSPVLAELEKEGLLSLASLSGKREVYLFRLLDRPFAGNREVLVIAGSDKRGTIYGLFHLSELLGVSPLVNWNHVLPQRREEVVLTDRDNLLSKEPSVKYRGFFINDEWPAFGTWATEHFGGINARCYEKVFELLLRLKGNYLWPAMWNSNFSLDGPGLESARLADELGVVMGTSHHEPCMRSGAEYGMVRGKDSPYGDAWSFLTNEEGIRRFWRDGLLRNKPFENIITMGMRGENDTAILGEGSTMKDNVDLLRRVLKAQNDLIRETVNPDLNQVPRLLVLFTEVEAFFYGDRNTPGLLGDPELDGVTLMLSDNNQGSTRTLPTKEMRNHRGGYGMYYHMDMHGGPMAFEWIGSTYLPKVWEEMTAAYDFGVREVWITNIGDIGTQEYGLSFFLDLAYDIDRFRGTDAGVTRQYTKNWMAQQFGHCFSPQLLSEMTDALWDSTRLLARRKHEVMNASVYHPVHYGEAEDVLSCCERLLLVAEKAKRLCPKDSEGALISLFAYPVCGTANLMKMWILAGRNALYARQNRLEANVLADEIAFCMEKDAKFTEEYHSVEGGMFNGFGLSEHIGFRCWNDENNQYPLMIRVFPVRKPRMIVARTTDEHYLTGGFWSEQPQTWTDALRPDVSEIAFDIACGSRDPVSYEILCDCPWLSFSSMRGTVSRTDHLTVTVHKELLHGKETGRFLVRNAGSGDAVIDVAAQSLSSLPPLPKGCFLETDDCIAMNADHFNMKKDVNGGAFSILSPYGRTDSAIKVFPVTADFYPEKDRPFAAYDFWALSAGCWRVRFYLSATTPVVNESCQYIGFSINDEPVQILNTVHEEDKPFFLSRQWEQEAHDCIKIQEAEVNCREGENRLFFYGMSPAIILERIVLWRKGTVLPESCLGPAESWRKQ